VNWRAFEEAAPDVARAGRAQLDKTGLALLGTLRKDGYPRISPVEPFFGAGELLFGAMSRSRKADDLLRDARCTLHSSLSDPEGGEPEFKLYGRAAEVLDDRLRLGAPEAWWASRPPDDAHVFSLEIAQAVLVGWDLDQGVMTVRRWSPRLGVTEARRSYP
jgi:Pyridoxamine 5'-phosphate oxidase